MPADPRDNLRWQGLWGLALRILLSGGLYLPVWLRRQRRALAVGPAGSGWTASDLLLTALVLGGWALLVVRCWDPALAPWPLWPLPAGALALTTGWSLALRPPLAATTAAPVSLPATLMLGPLYLQACINHWRQRRLESFRARYLRPPSP